MIRTEPETQTPGKILLLMGAAILLYGVLSGLRASTSVLISSISAWTGLTYGSVSIAFSVMNVVLAVTGPVFGMLTLKIPPARIMIGGAIAAFIGFLGAALVSTLPALILFLGVFFGLGASALCYSIVFAAAVPLIGVKRGALFSGILSASQGAISMIFAPVIMAEANVFGMQICLIFLAILTLCLIPLCLIFLPKRGMNAQRTVNYETSVPVKTPSFKKVITSLVKTPFFYMMVLGMLTYGICDGGMINHLFEYSQMFKVSVDFSAMLVSAYSFASMIGAVAGGIICAKYNNKKLGVCITYSLWAVVVLLSYTLPASYVMGTLLTIACGLCTGTSLPFFASITQDCVHIDIFAAIFSILYFFIIIAYSFDSLLGGLLYDVFKDFYLIDALAVLLALATAMVFLVSVIRDKSGKRERVSIL